MNMKKGFLGCVPSSIKDFPAKAFKAEGSIYEEGKCHFCGQGIWIGHRGKKLLEQGLVVPACPQCCKEQGCDFANMGVLSRQDA